MAFDSLPAVNVNLSDQGLKIAPQPSGPKVTLLGITSNTGISLREPFQVTNVGQASASLYFSGTAGDTYPGELSMALEEAIAGGAPNVEIVVIGHYNGAALESIVSPVGTDNSSRYADLTTAYDTIVNTDLDIVVPVGAWADCTGTTGNYTNQLANFCEQATNEFGNTSIGVIGMMPTLHWARTWSNATGLWANATLSGEAVALTGEGLTRFNIPSIALVDEWVKYATQDDEDGVATTPLVEATEAGFPTTFYNYLAGSNGADGTFYPENSDNVATDVAAVYWTSFQAQDSAGSVLLDAKGNRVDAGRRICVVGAPLITSNNTTKDLAKGLGVSLSNTVYNTDGAAAYAGFINTLAPHSSTTNKTLPAVVARRPMSAKQANKLAARRITTFLNKTNGFVVASGVTGAHNVSKYVRSDFVRLSTVRITDAAIAGVRSASEPFIGEANNALNRSAMQAEIDKFLFTMRSVGALNDYEFFVSSTPDQQVLGEVEITLTLVPAFEITKITQTVSLAKQL
jgi:hypothetical protein